MASRKLLIGTFSLLTATIALPATIPGQPPDTRLNPATGTAHLRVFGTRSALQRQSAASDKLDGALADLSRHLSFVRAGHELPDLRSLNPAARFLQHRAGEVPRVLIDAVTRGDPQNLKAALVGLGLEDASVYVNDVGGWLPVTQIEAAAARAEIHSIRAAMPRTRAEAFSQGDFAQRSA
jgi:hypothetical protein